MSSDEDNGEETPEDVIEEHEFEAEGWDEMPDDAEAVSKLLLALQGAVPDVLKRAVNAGVGGISESEDRLREALSEKRLPREAVAYLLEHADSFKQEFFKVLSREIREVLEEMDLGGELAKVLTRLSLEATINVRFRENPDSGNPDAVEPKASGRMRVRDTGAQDDASEDSEE